MAASLPVCEVDDLGVGGLLGVPEILGDDIAHPGDLGQLVAHLRDRQVEVLGADQEDVVGRAAPRPTCSRRETSSISPRVCLNCSFSLNRAMTFLSRGWNG